MSERTEERERTRAGTPRSDIDFDTDVDIDGLLSDSGGRSGASGSTKPSRSGELKKATRPARSGRSGFRERLRERRRGLFSPRVFVGVLVLALAVGLLGGFVPLIGGFAGLLGVFASAFVVGLVSRERHYVETGLAGATAAGIALLVTSLDIVFFMALRDTVPEIGVIGAGAGLLAALVGHYFGRDLREGLTADI